MLLALADLLRHRTPADGARILLGAFGAGLTWGAAVLEWGVEAPAPMVSRGAADGDGVPWAVPCSPH